MKALDYISELPPTALWSLGLAAVGWIIGPLLGYWFGLRSQRLQREHAAKSAAKDRRRDFIAYMHAWRHEIDRLHMHPGGGGFEHHISVFTDGTSDFLAAAHTISGDFTTAESRKRFEDLVAVVPKVYVHHHDKILKAIDDVIEHTKTAA